MRAIGPHLDAGTPESERTKDPIRRIAFPTGALPSRCVRLAVKSAFQQRNECLARISAALVTSFDLSLQQCHGNVVFGSTRMLAELLEIDSNDWPAISHPN